ncbi:MAG: hypothetical protein JXQ75_13225 [Phycisphaerae bacterium]|nr:hypothetical protein [Phycisphaerae bacterium]
MRGYVLAFRPATGDGTIVTDAGEAVKFTGGGRYAELHGGDIVSFQVGPGEGRLGGANACDIEVVQKWSDSLTASQDPVVRELYSTLDMDSPVH